MNAEGVQPFELEIKLKIIPKWVLAPMNKKEEVRRKFIVGMMTKEAEAIGAEIKGTILDKKIPILDIGSLPYNKYDLKGMYPFRMDGNRLLDRRNNVYFECPDPGLLALMCDSINNYLATYFVG
jgi:hypothetical protein